MWRGDLGAAYLLPALSSAGASLAFTMLPFPHPAGHIELASARPVEVSDSRMVGKP
jgi:hypothetical protein